MREGAQGALLSLKLLFFRVVAVLQHWGAVGLLDAAAIRL